MRIICTFGLLVTLLLIAFFIGVVAGTRLAADLPHEQVTAAASVWRGSLA